MRSFYFAFLVLLSTVSSKAPGQSERAETIIYLSKPTVTCKTYIGCSASAVNNAGESLDTDGVASAMQIAHDFETQRRRETALIQFHGSLPDYKGPTVPEVDINWLKVSYEFGQGTAKGIRRRFGPYSLLYGAGSAAEEFIEQYEDESKRIEMQNYIKKTNETAVETIQEGQIAVLGNQVVLQGSIKSVEEEVAAANQQLDKILADQQLLKSELEELQKDGVKNAALIKQKQAELEQLNREGNAQAADLAREIGFIKSETFRNLSPSRQLALLKGGFAGDPAENKKLQMQISQLNFKISFDAFSKQANKALGVASNLGIDLPEFAVEAVGVLGAANSAYKALNLASPDYLGAALAVSSLVAKKQDVQAERFKAVMQKLDKIDEKLTDVLANQEEMLKNQRNILAGLNSLSAQVQASSELIISVINAQHSKTRRAIADLSKEGLAQCEVISDKLSRIEPGANVYDEVKKVFKQASIQFKDCHSAMNAKIDTFMGDATPVHSLFLFGQGGAIKPDDGTTEWNEDYMELVYFPALDYLNTKSSQADSTEADLLALLIPGETVGFLQERLEMASLFSKSTFNEINETTYKGKLDYTFLRSNLIDPEITVILLNPLVDIHYLYSFFSEDADILSGKLIERENLGAISGIHSVGQERLKQAIAILGLAVMQQNILTGSILLPYLYDDFISNDNERQKSALVVVGLTPELTENFARYFVHRRLTDLGRSVAQYSFATRLGYVSDIENFLEIGDFAFLECVEKETADTCKDISLGSGFSIALDNHPDFKLPLPHHMIVEDRSLVKSVWGLKIEELRSKLASEYAGYNSDLLQTNIDGTEFRLEGSLIEEFHYIEIASEAGWLR